VAVLKPANERCWHNEAVEGVEVAGSQVDVHPAVPVGRFMAVVVLSFFGGVFRVAVRGSVGSVTQ
jgi:hypothetical protein